MGHFCKFRLGFVSDRSSASSYSSFRLKWMFFLSGMLVSVPLHSCGTVLGLWPWAVAPADHRQPGLFQPSGQLLTRAAQSRGGPRSISGAVWWALQIPQLWEGNQLPARTLTTKSVVVYWIWRVFSAKSCRFGQQDWQTFFFPSFFSFFPWKVLSQHKL